MTRTDKAGSQQWTAGFVIVGTRQHCVAKICNASQRANAHKLQSGCVGSVYHMRSLAVSRFSLFLAIKVKLGVKRGQRKYEPRPDWSPQTSLNLFKWEFPLHPSSCSRACSPNMSSKCGYISQFDGQSPANSWSLRWDPRTLNHFCRIVIFDF